MLSGQAFADELNITLKCEGSGTVSATETTITTNRDKKHHSKEVGTEQAMVKRPFTGTTYVEIRGNMGQVKLPMGILPTFQHDDASKWFPINDLSVNNNEVKGEVRINMLNQPDLTIDRTNGSIVIANSLGDFTGQCKVFIKTPSHYFN